MSKDEKATRDRIHEIARLEFLDKGFQGASLRNVVKEAGVTTGSFYWYYSSKEDLPCGEAAETPAVLICQA